MTQSDKIQLVAICVSLFIGISSIIIAIFTLRQTKKINQEANRPYFAIYIENITLCGINSTYLVLKNFGNTGAYIDKIEMTPDYQLHGISPLISLNGCFIAPKQSFSTILEGSNEKAPKINFTVAYHDFVKSYSDEFTIDSEPIKGQITMLVNSLNKSGEVVAMYDVCKELIRHNF